MMTKTQIYAAVSCLLLSGTALPAMAQDVDLLSFDRVAVPKQVDAPPAEIRPEPVKPAPLPAKAVEEVPAASSGEIIVEEKIVEETAAPAPDEKKPVEGIAPSRPQPPVPAAVAAKATVRPVKEAPAKIAAVPKEIPRKTPPPVLKKEEKKPVLAVVKKETAPAPVKHEAPPVAAVVTPPPELKPEPAAPAGPEETVKLRHVPKMPEMASAKGPTFKLPDTETGQEKKAEEQKAETSADVQPPPPPSLTVMPVARAFPAGAGTLVPGSALKIEVVGEPDMSGWYRVKGDGTVMMPLLGKFQAGGLTTGQLAEKLTAAYKDGYLVNPQVKVTEEKVD